MVFVVGVLLNLLHLHVPCVLEVGGGNECVSGLGFVTPSVDAENLELQRLVLHVRSSLVKVVDHGLEAAWRGLDHAVLADGLVRVFVMQDAAVHRHEVFEFVLF